MKVFTATEAKNRFGELIEQSASEPVAIQRNGRNIRVILSAEEFERLTAAAPDSARSAMVRALHKRSIERRREVYEELAK